MIDTYYLQSLHRHRALQGLPSAPGQCCPPGPLSPTACLLPAHATKLFDICTDTYCMRPPTRSQSIRQLCNTRHIKNSLCSICYRETQTYHGLSVQIRRKTGVGTTTYLDWQGRAWAPDTHKFALGIIDDYRLEVACKNSSSSRLGAI